MRHITTCPIGARHFICRRAKTGKVHTEPAEWLLHDRGLQNACERAYAMRVSESKNTTGVLAHTRPMYSKYMSFCCCGGAVGLTSATEAFGSDDMHKVCTHVRV